MGPWDKFQRIGFVLWFIYHIVFSKICFHFQSQLWTKREEGQEKRERCGKDAGMVMTKAACLPEKDELERGGTG